MPELDIKGAFVAPFQWQRSQARWEGVGIAEVLLDSSLMPAYLVSHLPLLLMVLIDFDSIVTSCKRSVQILAITEPQKLKCRRDQGGLSGGIRSTVV